MENVYFAVMAKDVGDDGKERMVAYCKVANESVNIKCVFDDNRIIAANFCPTKKRAKEIVDAWNESFKKNGTYLFDTPKF